MTHHSQKGSNANFRLAIVFFSITFLSHLIVKAQYGDSTTLFSQLSSNVKKDKLQALTAIHENYYRWNYKKSVSYALQALALSAELHDKQSEARAYLTLTSAYGFLGDERLSKFYNRKILEIANKLNDRHLLAKAYCSLGRNCLHNGEKEKALDYIMNALILDSLNEEVSANASAQLGILYSDAGEHDKSTYYYLKALNLREKRNEWIEAAYINNNIAGFYFVSMGFNKGMKYLRLALSEFSKANYLPGEAYICNSIGMAYLGQNQKDSALVYFHKALYINTKDDGIIWSSIIFNLVNIGDTWLNSGRFDSAAYYYEKGKVLADKGSDNIPKACVYLSLGKMNENKKKYSIAISFLRQGLNFAEKGNFRSIFEEAYTHISGCYEAMGNKEEALVYLKKRNELKDSIFNARSQEDVANMMIRYETKKKEKEILNLQQLSLMKQRRIRISVIIVFSLLLLIAAASWGIWQYYRQKVGPKMKIVNFIERRLGEEKEGDNRKLRALEKVLPPELQSANKIPAIEFEADEKLLLRLEDLMSKEKAFVNENLTLAEVARLINTNTSYLSRLINEHFHVNFSAYLNKFRIDEAKRMILDEKYSHLSIEGIAQSSGFRSKSTFNKVFKQSTGLTPTEFAQSVSASL
jgi:AraC-like DNA-binding protein/tetratricopeptide (TPR) repeat protein